MCVETGSVFLLTLFGSLQYFGRLVAPVFGMAGERLGHRNVLCAMRIGYVALASTRMALAFAAAIVRKLTTCSSAAKGQSDDERAQENSHRSYDHLRELRLEFWVIADIIAIFPEL